MGDISVSHWGRTPRVSHGHCAYCTWAMPCRYNPRPRVVLEKKGGQVAHRTYPIIKDSPNERVSNTVEQILGLSVVVPLVRIVELLLDILDIPCGVGCVCVGVCV